MTTILDFAFVAVPLTLAVLALLVLGRRHIHGQMAQIAVAAKARAAARSEQTVHFPISGSPTPQFSRERSALKDALVEFFSHSKGSSRILRLLSTKTKPIGYKALMDEIRFDEKRNPNRRDLPASAIRAVLSISQAAGLARLTRHGFSITEVGREVHRRIEPSTCVQKPLPSAARSISGNGRRAATSFSSADRTVLRRLRKRARTLIHQ
jgi:hypothetical protein